LPNASSTLVGSILESSKTARTVSSLNSSGGAILWALALLMMTTIGSVHTAIREGRQDDPGPTASNFGKMSPIGSLMGHIVYGVSLGLTYSAWPLS
jgi:hypothetical protein